MLSVRMLALPLVGLALLEGRVAASSPEASIVSAAAAPYTDVLKRDATALCADLVPAVAAQLVRGSAAGSDCEVAVGQIFAETAQSEESANGGVSVQPVVKHLEFTGQHATVKIAFKATKTTKRHGTTVVQFGESGTMTINLEEVSGRWLVSSPARLAAITGCRRITPPRCVHGAKVLLFSLGELEVPGPVETLVPIPAAVRRAGAREESEFKAGMAVAAQTGCAACHRFGKNGNAGPGPNLTHIGSKLSDRQLKHALVDSRAPMPSFRNLSAYKSRAIVRFLSLLR